MFVRKIQTAVKTCSLQRNQNTACASGSTLSGEWECSSSDWMPGLARQEAPEVPVGNLPNFSQCYRLLHSRNCKSLQVEKKPQLNY